MMKIFFIFSTIFIKSVVLAATSTNLECNRIYDDLKINFMFLERENAFKILPNPSSKNLKSVENAKKNLEEIEKTLVLNFKRTKDAILICQGFISYLEDRNYAKLTKHYISSDLLQNIKTILVFTNRMVIAIGNYNNVFTRLIDTSQVYDTEVDVNTRTPDHRGIFYKEEYDKSEAGKYSVETSVIRTISLLKSIKDMLLQNIREYDNLIKIWKDESKKAFDVATVENKHAKLKADIGEYKLQLKTNKEIDAFWENIDREQRSNHLHPFFGQGHRRITLDFIKKAIKTKRIIATPEKNEEQIDGSLKPCNIGVCCMRYY